MLRLSAIVLLVCLACGLVLTAMPAPSANAAPAPPEPSIAPAEQPAVQPFIPRHKPGREHPSARSATNGVPTLDQLIARGVQSDPLSANPTILKLNQIAVVSPLASTGFQQLASSIYTATSASYQLVSARDYVGSSTRQLLGSAAAGDLNGDGQDELISPVVDPFQSMCLSYSIQTFTTSLSYAATAQSTCEPLWTIFPADSPEVQVKTGFFFSPPYTSTTPIAQLATAFQRANFDLCLRLWVPSAPGSLELQWKEHLCPVNLGASLRKHPDTPGFSLAVGDFNGNGQDELALGWIDTTGKVWVATFQATPSGALQQQALTQVVVTDPTGSFAQVPLGGNLSLTAGDFDGNGSDELAVAVFGNTPDLRRRIHLQHDLHPARASSRHGQQHHPHRRVE
ncbi:MAG: hypothetical protein KatS3mg060_2717 [Dehalococcoidia bacterium]|nr:MAG: hypothetical protein KatS3mg060_2717 [Dehalococcoidia bacterium]